MCVYVCVSGQQSCLGTNLLIDPICEEESYQDGSLMITCMPSRNEVTQLTVTGEWSTAKVHEVCNLNFSQQSNLVVKFIAILNSIPHLDKNSIVILA